MAKKRKQSTKKNLKLLIWVLLVVFVVAVIVVLATQGYFDKSNNDIPQNKPPVGNIDGDTIKIHFVSVGQGDAIVIELTDKKYMVIDAGSGTRVTAATRTQYSQYLDDVVDGDTISYLVATHPDSDHINMLSDVLAAYKVENIYYNYISNPSSTYAKFMEDAQNEEDAALTVISDGNDSTYTIDNGNCQLTLYSSGNDGFAEGTVANGMSIMCLLTYGGRSILFAGDAPSAEEQWFVGYTNDNTFDIDFLKVAHHGSASSSCNEFLGYVKAEYAIICVDEKNNKYGHPTQSALNRLADYDMTVYRTDINGNIVLTIDYDGDYLFTFSKPAEQ